MAGSGLPSGRNVTLTLLIILYKTWLISLFLSLWAVSNSLILSPAVPLCSLSLSHFSKSGILLHFPTCEERSRRLCGSDAFTTTGKCCVFLFSHIDTSPPISQNLQIPHSLSHFLIYNRSGFFCTAPPKTFRKHPVSSAFPKATLVSPHSFITVSFLLHSSSVPVSHPHTFA